MKPTLDRCGRGAGRRDGRRRPDLRPDQRDRGDGRTRSPRRPTCWSDRSTPTRPSRQRQGLRQLPPDRRARAWPRACPTPASPMRCGRRRWPSSTRSRSARPTERPRWRRRDPHRGPTPSAVHRSDAMPTPDLSGSTSRQRALDSDRVFRALALAAGLLVLAILALIPVTTLSRPGRRCSTPALDFVTSSHWVPNDPDGSGPLTAQFGVLAFVYGTAGRLGHRPGARRARERRHRPVPHRAGAPPAPLGRDHRHRPAGRRPVGGVRAVGHRRPGPEPPGLLRPHGQRGRSPSRCSTRSSATAPGAQLHDRRDHPGHHDHADHHLDHPRGVRHRAGRREGTPPWPSAPPGGR